MYKNSHNFFIKNGYIIFNLFSKNEIDLISKDIISRLRYLTNNYITFSKLKGNIGNYHKLKLTNIIESKCVKGSTRFIILREKILEKIYQNKSILNITNKYWGHSKYMINWVGDLNKKELKKNATGYRIARPFNIAPKDVGGVHLDLHYGGIIRKDYFATFTIWIPLNGFSEKYTLRLAPKSHLKSHSNQFISKQKKYVSKSFDKKYEKKFSYIRPVLKKGQGILFHPNLMHGGSINKGSITRSSIDIRIFNKPNFNPYNSKK